MAFLIMFHKVMKLEIFEWLESIDVSDVYPLRMNMQRYINCNKLH